MKILAVIACVAALPLFAFTPNVEPDAALKRIMEGNERYATDKSTCPNSGEVRRQALVSKQNPFAIIVGCSDSRVTPDMVFDQGNGDLFVVRLAGNVIGDAAIESIDYGVRYLNAALIVVLGHSNCGAVTAVLEGQTRDIPTIASKIEPSIRGINKNQPDALEKAIKANVDAGVAKVRSDPRLRNLIESNQVKVVGAYYKLDTGRVELLP